MFHRIAEAEMWSMTSARFAKLAERLPAYSGAVRASLFAAAQAEQGDAGEPQVPSGAGLPVQGAEESFESRMARAKPILANAAGEAQISRLMAAGA